jgi:hypothetical protein
MKCNTHVLFKFTFDFGRIRITKRYIFQILIVFITLVLLSIASIVMYYFWILDIRIYWNINIKYIPIVFLLLNASLFIELYIKKKRKLNVRDRFSLVLWYLPMTFSLFFILTRFEVFRLHPPGPAQTENIVMYLIFFLIMIFISSIFIKYRNRELTRTKWIIYFACNIMFSCLLWAFSYFCTWAAAFGLAMSGI